MALIFLDLETTGLDPATDRILEIAAARVEVDPVEVLRPVDGFACVIRPNEGVSLGMDAYVTEMHTKNGLLAELQGPSAVTFSQAQQAFCAWLKVQGDGLHTLAGNAVHFDLSFLRSWMAPAAARFSHRLLDVSAFRVARELGGMPKCPISAGDAHRAQGDVLASIAQARWYLSRLTP